MMKKLFEALLSYFFPYEPMEDIEYEPVYVLDSIQLYSLFLRK
jgi:hypothetical protein